MAGTKRRILNLASIGVCLLTAGGLAVGGRSTYEIVAQLAAAGFYGLAAGVMGKFGVVLTPAGITLRGWMTRYYAWPEVRSIKAVNFLWMRRAQVELTKGSKIRTWAPYDDFLLTDLKFDAKVEAMRDWHAHHQPPARDIVNINPLISPNGQH